MPHPSVEFIIGLEIHLQLNTRSKIFSCEANTFGQQPNFFISERTFAEPGALPIINQACVEKTIRLALACHSKIAHLLLFDRKSYYYPDLPKGYQITQDRKPLAMGGHIMLSNNQSVQLKQIHLEEDSGASIHTDNGILLDYNRAGAPLIEIVTEPTLQHPEQAALLVKEVVRLSRWLQISNANMEEGSLRCDANISVKNNHLQSGRSEIKNLNSTTQLIKALHYEYDLLCESLILGEPQKNQTKTFDPVTGKTILLRLKEDKENYRYSPENDLAPVLISDEMINKQSALSQEIPSAKAIYLQQELQLPYNDAVLITQYKWRYDLFTNLCQITKTSTALKIVKNLIPKTLHDDVDIDQLFSRSQLMLAYIQEHRLPLNEILKSKFSEGLLQKELDEEALFQNYQATINDIELQHLAEQILLAYPTESHRLKNGDTKLIGFFIGQIKSQLKTKIDIQHIRKALDEALANKPEQ